MPSQARWRVAVPNVREFATSAASLSSESQLATMGLPIDTRYFRCFMRVHGVRKIERGVELDVEEERMRIEAIRPDILRIKISRSGSFDDHPTFAVCADLDADAPPEFTVEETDEQVRIATAQMSVTVGKQPFSIASHRADGTTIFESATDAEGRSWAYATLNDDFITARSCLREDAFFGLGERSGRFNRKGRNFMLWNTDVLNDVTERDAEILYGKDDPRAVVRGTDFDPYYVSIPLFYHLPHQHHGMAGFFFDNGYRGDFEFEDPLEYRVHFSGGQYTEYIFCGPAMRGILSAYTWLTGRMAAPPMWALGHHQCRWFAYTQQAVEQLATTHRDKRIPTDAVWLD
ncbi:MAG: alpha-glucosidase, partial [Chthoniobacter sp.]|nr:alpha-glucosidase [Chthoniobacter sp.]